MRKEVSPLQDVVTHRLQSNMPILNKERSKTMALVLSAMSIQLYVSSCINGPRTVITTPPVATKISLLPPGGSARLAIVW